MIKQPFPALPDYDGPPSGVYSCVHHDILTEYSWNILERLLVIDRDKPESERATRKSSIVYLDPTGQPWEQPFREYDAARAKCVAAPAKFVAATAKYGVTRAKYVAATAKYVATRAEYGVAAAKYIAAGAKYASQIEAQIRALVPDLPWNGKELVFPKEVTA